MNRATLVWLLPAVLLSTYGLWAAGARDARGERGDQEGAIQHDGRERTYLLHVPPQYDGTQPLPLVMFFHGGMGTARHAASTYGWNQKADEKGFLVVYPNGSGSIQTWNVMHGCGSAHRNNVDDVGFVRALLKELQTKWKIDSKRIYSTGMSNGGMLTHRLAAEMPELIAAAAPVAGCIGGKVGANAEEKRIPQPASPVPIIIIHGKQDTSVMYDGGQTQGAEPNRHDLSVAEAVAHWTKANGCAGAPQKEESHGGNVLKEAYASDTGADVVLYTVVDGGHAWPGGTKRAFRSAGKNKGGETINATDTVWAFFENHAKK